MCDGVARMHGYTGYYYEDDDCISRVRGVRGCGYQATMPTKPTALPPALAAWLTFNDFSNFSLGFCAFFF